MKAIMVLEPARLPGASTATIEDMVTIMAAAIARAGAGATGAPGRPAPEGGAFAQPQGPLLVRRCLGPSRSRNFRDWVVVCLQTCGAVQNNCHIHELESIALALDIMVEDVGGITELAAGGQAFEGVSRD